MTYYKGIVFEEMTEKNGL